MRWRLRLEEYEYDIEYTKGKDNTAADALSRIHAIRGKRKVRNLKAGYILAMKKNLMNGKKATNYPKD